MIVDALGRIVAARLLRRSILTAELDTDDIPRGKFDFDAVGHYARPDIFTLMVNEQPMQPVVGKTSE